MTTFRAAKTIYDMKSGKVTNLSLQKLLYLSHMVHLGTESAPLASNKFQAWDYGPVEPELYHKLKAYGASHVPDIFSAQPYLSNDQEYVSIKTVMDQLRDASSRKLVAITHWDNGAWAKHYRRGTRGIVIPDSDILEEFNVRSSSKHTEAA